MEQTSLDEWIAITHERARARERRSTALGWMVNATMPEIRRQIHSPTAEHEAHKQAIQAAFTRAGVYADALPETVVVDGAIWRLRDEVTGVTADLVRAVGNAPFAVGDQRATKSLKLLLAPFVRYSQYQQLEELYPPDTPPKRSRSISRRPNDR